MTPAYAEDPGKAYRVIRGKILHETIEGLEVTLSEKNILQNFDASAIWPLSLQECTQLVLKQNSNIKIAYLSVDSVSLDIEKQKAVFDPLSRASTEYAHARTPAADGLGSTPSEVFTNSTSIQKKFITGGTLALSGAVARSGLDGPHVYGSDVSLSVSQPLLKNFGVDLTNLKIARNNYDIALEDLKDQIIDQISQAQNAYWEVLNAGEVLETRKTSYQQALELVSHAKKGMKLGNRTKIDVLQARASAASREENVFQAEKDLEDRQDELRKRMSGPALALWDVRTIETEKLDPKFTPVDVTFQSSLEEAFGNRPDYLKALKQVKNNRFSLSISRNGLLPDLSFNYVLNLNGSGDTGKDTFNRAFSGRFPENTVGLAFSMPWFDRSERADYNQKKNESRAQELRVKDLALTIFQEVREAVRAVHTGIRRVKAAQKAYRLELKKLEAEQKRYQIGVATSFEVLSFQQDLANARIARIRALVDYRQAVIRLWQTLGVSLEKNGIRMEDSP